MDGWDARLVSDPEGVEACEGARRAEAEEAETPMTLVWHNPLLCERGRTTGIDWCLCWARHNALAGIR